MKYDKLIRDNIPSILESKGHDFCIKQVDGPLLQSYVCKKLIEESNEFLEDPSIEELADLQEVIYGALKAYGWSTFDLSLAVEMKRHKKGGFYKGIILKEVFE